MSTRRTGRARSGREFLARLSGEPVGRLETEPAAMGRGLVALAREAASLVRGYASEDLATREAAYRRWAELDSMLPRSNRSPAPCEGLSPADRERLRAALTKVVDTLHELERSAGNGAPSAGEDPP